MMSRTNPHFAIEATIHNVTFKEMVRTFFKEFHKKYYRRKKFWYFFDIEKRYRLIERKKKKCV
ncbi:hypothetical protein KKH43_03805 [Patescibacteria group bacterium]|nr:hypothetical protein [Patescibacteria group bacterium]